VSAEEDHGIYAPGFGLEGTPVIFPVSTEMALMGSVEGEEDVVEGDIFIVGRLNSVIVSNAEKQVYAHDYSFNYMRPFLRKLEAKRRLFRTKRSWKQGSPKRRRSCNYGPNNYEPNRGFSRLIAPKDVADGLICPVRVGACAPVSWQSARGS
jgi:hypothetical protein